MTLKEALQIVIVDESLEDFVYDIRSRAVEGGPKFDGNSWDHPRVTRWAAAVERLKEELK